MSAALSSSMCGSFLERHVWPLNRSIRDPKAWTAMEGVWGIWIPLHYPNLYPLACIRFDVLSAPFRRFRSRLYIPSCCLCDVAKNLFNLTIILIEKVGTLILKDSIQCSLADLPGAFCGCFRALFKKLLRRSASLAPLATICAKRPVCISAGTGESSVFLSRLRAQ